MLTNSTLQSKKVIVIIEDDIDDILFLREALRKIDSNIDLIEIESGPDLFMLLKQGTLYATDLFIIEFSLSPMNGLEIFEGLKSTPPYNLVPCVMLSGLIDPSLHLLASRIGFNYIYEKPTNLQEYDELAILLKKIYRGSSAS